MSTEHVSLWNQCLDIIKNNVEEQTYNTWFKQISPLKLEDKTLTVQVPSPFFHEYIEEHFIDLIKNTLNRVIGPGTKLMYEIITINQSDIKTTTEIPSNHTFSGRKICDPFKTQQYTDLDPRLNPHYTFDNFVEGKSNKLACVAGKGVAQQPGKTAFNPLFIHGESGVGKTHLLQAIGAKTKEIDPQKRVLYVTAYQFKVQFMDAVNKNQQNDFIHFYQTIDVLLIDDIQEFSGIAGTQNTFFHIFNHLHQNGKQLVLSSDRPPALLQSMEQRLLSRFKWGLDAPLEKPDFDLRKSILQSKIKRDGLTISEDVIGYIAEHLSDNVRDLEGALVSLMARSIVHNIDIDLSLAREVIEHSSQQKNSQPTISSIEEAVCKYYNMDVKNIYSKSRKREIVQARQIIMYLSKKYTDHSLAHIGALVGKRDHATVLHSCKMITNLIEVDKEIRMSVQTLEKSICR